MSEEKVVRQPSGVCTAVCSAPRSEPVKCRQRSSEDDELGADTGRAETLSRESPVALRDALASRHGT